MEERNKIRLSMLHACKEPSIGYAGSLVWDVGNRFRICGLSDSGYQGHSALLRGGSMRR